MKLLRPFRNGYKHRLLSDVSLVSSTVNATDAENAPQGVWAVGTTYALGALVQVDSPTFTFTAVANSTILTATAHGWANDHVVKVSTTTTLPAGLTAATDYYIVQATTDTFKLSLTKNGAPIITTTTGTGTHTVTVASHRIYESLVGSNLGNVPHKSPTQWFDVGATNRWKCLDGSVTSQTEASGTMTYVMQTQGRIDGLAFMNISCAEIIISARTSTMAVGATTNAAGYSIGATTVTLASAGTGAIAIGDLIRFSNHTTQYTITAGDADVSGGGTISFTPALTSSIPTSATAITVTVYGYETYSMISSLEISSFWSWFWEPILRKFNFVDIDLPSTYSNLEITVTLNDTGNTVKCGALIVGLSKIIGYTQYGASIGITDYSRKSQDDWGNWSITEGLYSDRGTFQVLVDRLAVDNTKYTLAQYRATPLVVVGSDSYESTIVYGFIKDFSVGIDYPSYSVLNIDVESLV